MSENRRFGIFCAVVGAIVSAMIAGAMLFDRYSPEVGKRCAVAGEHACYGPASSVLVCRHWDSLDGLAWDHEKDCHPGTCSEGRCQPR